MEITPLKFRNGLSLKLICSFFFLFGLSSLTAKDLFDLPIDQKSIDRDSGFTPHSYASMLKGTTPSIVSVHTAKIVRIVQSQGLSPHDELLRRFFGFPSPRRAPRGQGEPEVEERKLPQGVGSGVILTADGYIITNNHVISSESGEDADEILVGLDDGRELPAKLIGRDPKTDVAIIKVDATDLPAITIADSDNIAVGDIVFAIGNPMGVGLTVTQGIVSATGRSIGIYGREGYENFIQTDASINPGNSGGALVDSLGRLVGINSAILSRTGGNIGIGFAIPSMLAVNTSKHLINFGEVKRGFLGISISDLTPDMAEAFGLSDVKGVLINNVEEGFPAEEAGLERGDIITAIDGKKVETANELRLRVGQAPPGTTIEISLLRKRKEKIIEATVGDQETGLASMSSEIFEGVVSSILSDEHRKSFAIPQDVEGIVLTQIQATSPFVRHFRPGVVIMEINDTVVESVPQAKKLLHPGVNKLYVFDRGRISYLAIRLQ